MAFEYRTGQGIQHDADRGPGSDLAQVVLGHVGRDPHIVNGDQGHQGRTGCGELADIGAQVGDQAVRAGTYDAVGQVQFGLVHIGDGGEQLGIFFVTATLGFAGAFYFCPRGGDMGDGRIEGGPGNFQATQGDGSGIFLVQAFQALQVLTGHDFVGLRCFERRHLGVNACGIGADLLAGGLQVGTRAIDSDLVVLWVDFEQHFAGLDVLVVAHVDFGHPAGDLRRHRNDKRLHPCLLRVGGIAVGQQVPNQARKDQHGHPIHRFFGRVGRRRGFFHLLLAVTQLTPSFASSSRSPQSVRCCICWRVAGSSSGRLLYQPPPRALYSAIRLLTAVLRLTR
ncbi:hypothetical protein D3C79_552230 [compost metagenome]